MKHQPGTRHWLVYALLIAAVALIAWEDFFATIARGSAAESLLNQGTPVTYALFVAALALPFIYIAAARLRYLGLAPKRANVATILYFFAALGFILDGSTVSATAPLVGYAWTIFLTTIYIPVTTIAAVLLTSTTPTATAGKAPCQASTEPR